MAGAHGSKGTKESCQLNETIIAYWYNLSRITCKWFGYCEIALARATLPELLDRVPSRDKTAAGYSYHSRGEKYCADIEVGQGESHSKSAPTNRAPFDEPKTKSMRHTGASHRV